MSHAHGTEMATSLTNGTVTGGRNGDIKIITGSGGAGRPPLGILTRGLHPGNISVNWSLGGGLGRGLGGARVRLLKLKTHSSYLLYFLGV